MASGRLVDWLGSGVIADRPATPDLMTGALGLWYATDTDTLSAWDGATWEDVAGGGGSGTVDSVVSGTGIDIDATDPANPIANLDSASIASLALADTATQPGDLAAIATSGDVGDLTGFPGGASTFLREDGTFAVPPGTGLTNPMTTAEDLIVGGASGTPTRQGFAANTFPARASTGGMVAKAITDFALTILDDTNAAGVRTTIGAGTGNGDFSGPGSSVDNTLVRFDGTGGKTGQASGVIVDDNNAISGYIGSLNKQTGTSYTLVAGDTGKIVELSNAAAIALTAANTLPEGFACTIVQGGAGQVTIASTGSGTVVNRQSHTKTAGLNAMCSVYVRSNSGTNAVFVLGGDTAA